MMLSQIALGVAVTALAVAVAALLSAHRHPFRRALKTQTEAIEDLQTAFARYKATIDEEVDKAIKRYREARRTYRELADAVVPDDEGPPADEEAQGVSGGDGRGGANSGVRGVSPAVVAAGIWPGGRSG